MAYGITSEAQLIDVATIKSGCQAYINALDFFVEAGKSAKEAGSLCNAQALSVDGCSFESNLMELGQNAIDKQSELTAAANAVYSQAVSVYNAQVDELNEYRRKIAAQRAREQARASQKRGVLNG